MMSTLKRFSANFCLLHFYINFYIFNIILLLDQIFPNMGACIAFNFIFAPKYDCSFHDSKCAWQETQVPLEL